MPPWPTVSWVDAAVRMEPRVGPTQGVQATAKAAPATSGPPEPAREISASGRHSLFSAGTSGVSRKKTPSATMIAPATLSSVPRESCSVDPSPVAVIPSATKTTVNDRQKTNAGKRKGLRRRSTVRISASETPDTADMYFFFQAEDGIRDESVTGVQT